MGRWPRTPVFSALSLSLLAGLVLFGPWVSPSSAGGSLSGPIGAQVIRVLDGDTLEVSAHIWLGLRIETRVRLTGIDAPEMRSACPRERELALRARAFLVALLEPEGDGLIQVNLYDIRLGKYSGRVLARVLAENGEDLGHSLLSAGLVHPYAGGGRRDWCGAAG